nr:uncharacterized protein LOC128703524 [Cherax quadricarinatus]
MVCSALAFVSWMAFSTMALQYASGSERREGTKANSPLELVTGFQKTDGLKKKFHVLKNKVDSSHERVGDLEQTEGWENEEGDLKKHAEIWNHMGRFKHVDRLKHEEVRKEVAVKVQEVVEQHLSRCHLVLATTTQLSPTFTSILRQLVEEGARGSVVVVVAELFSGEKLAQENLLQGLWRGSTLTCQAFIFYLEDANTDIMIRFLEESRLWHRPQTVVVLVGEEDRMEALLHHSSLRNSIHTLYIAIDWSNRTKPPVKKWLKGGAVNEAGETNGMRTYPARETEGVRTYPAKKPKE